METALEARQLLADPNVSAGHRFFEFLDNTGRLACKSLEASVQQMADYCDVLAPAYF